jgi:hypothetical protein
MQGADMRGFGLIVLAISVGTPALAQSDWTVVPKSAPWPIDSSPPQRSYGTIDYGLSTPSRSYGVIDYGLDPPPPRAQSWIPATPGATTGRNAYELPPPRGATFDARPAGTMDYGLNPAAPPPRSDGTINYGLSGGRR